MSSNIIYDFFCNSSFRSKIISHPDQAFKTYSTSDLTLTAADFIKMLAQFVNDNPNLGGLCDVRPCIPTVVTSDSKYSTDPTPGSTEKIPDISFTVCGGFKDTKARKLLRSALTAINSAIDLADNGSDQTQLQNSHDAIQLMLNIL